MSRKPNMSALPELIGQVIEGQAKTNEVLNKLASDMSGIKAWKDSQDNQATRFYDWQNQSETRLRTLEKEIIGQDQLSQGIKRLEESIKDLKTEINKSVGNHKTDQEKVNKELREEIKKLREKGIKTDLIDRILTWGTAVGGSMIIHHFFGH